MTISAVRLNRRSRSKRRDWPIPLRFLLLVHFFLRRTARAWTCADECCDGDGQGRPKGFAWEVRISLNFPSGSVVARLNPQDPKRSSSTPDLSVRIQPQLHSSVRKLGAARTRILVRNPRRRVAIAIGIGARLPGTPPTPPSMRVRARRFVARMQANANALRD
jgi:hypothetical protein